MQPLTSWSSGMLSKKIMELSEDVCLRRNCYTAACFKVATKFRSLYFIMLNEGIRFARLVLYYSAVDLERFLQLLLQWSRYR